MSAVDLQGLLDAAVKEEADLTAKQGELVQAQTDRDAAKAVYDEKQAAVQNVTAATSQEKAELVAALRAIADQAGALADQLGS
jgi:hypothetical protein